MQPKRLAWSSRALWLCLLALALLLACRLPQAPGAETDSALPSSSTRQSPLVVQSPIETPQAPGGGLLPLPPSRWTLPLFVLAGLLLFVLTGVGAYVLIRGLPGGRRAAPTPRPVPAGVAEEAEPPTERPTRSPGTLLDEGRYLILAIRSAAEGADVYEVKPTVPLDLCPGCFAKLQEGVGSTCPRCGRVLQEPRPSHPVLLAQETPDEARFARVSQLMAHDLAHASVIAPIDAFVETSFGPARRFVVVPDVESRRASTVSERQPVDAVVSWGIALAEGLSHLHEQRVMLTDIGPASVVLDGNTARWWCTDNVILFDDANEDVRKVEPTARQAASNNVRDLAGELVRLATGGRGDCVGRGDRVGRGVRAASTLSEPVARVLMQVLRSSGVLKAADFAVALARAREAMDQTAHVSYALGAHTDVGRLRKVNEDGLFAADLSADQVTAAHAVAAADADAAVAGPVAVVAVADGVGGHSAGDVASRLAVEALTRETDLLRTELVAGREVQAKAWLGRAVTAANRLVLSERLEASNDMGSTLVMALVRGRSATVLNVGDSRAYWLTPSGMRQVTTDHSLVQRLISIGQLTPEEARHHPQKSVIYRVLGDKEQLTHDLFEVKMSPGDALLLCSDGLTDMVEDRVLWNVWREAASPQDACEQLVDLANEAGGYDNVTVVIAQVEA